MDHIAPRDRDFVVDLEGGVRDNIEESSKDAILGVRTQSNSLLAKVRGAFADGTTNNEEKVHLCVDVPNCGVFQDDTVFDQDLGGEDDDDDDQSSQSQNDDDLEEENDDIVLSENDEEEELLEEEDLNSNATVPTAVPSSSAVTVASIPMATPTKNPVPSPKRQRATPEMTVTTTTTAVLIQKPQPIPQFDESRRLFQRLWTDEDEIELLQGFLEYTTTRGGGSGGGNNHHHNDTALFYDQIKSKLQLDFNKNQLVEKLRRLKKKYKNVLNKISSGKDFSFKSPHDQATFEISRKIWSSTGKITGFSNEDGNDDDDAATGGNVNANLNNAHFSNSNLVDADVVKIEDQKSTPRSRKRSRARVKMEEKQVGNDGGFVGNESNVNNGGNNGNLVSMIEETVKSCLSPLFKELLSNAATAGVGVGSIGRGIGGLAMNAMPLSFGGGEMMMMMDEKWRKQHILELEVYSKRLELVQDQIKTQLDELRSMGE